MDDKKRNIQPSVKHESWEDLLSALELTYTTSFKEVCRILRASRSWTNKYVKPFIPFVFISSGRRGDTTSGKINWVKMAAMQLDRPEMTESVWFHTEDFRAFIKNSIVSCTKQTKPVPMTYLIPTDQVEEFVAERKELRQAMKEFDSIKEYVALVERYNSLPFLYFRFDPATKQLLENQVRITERTKAPAIPVPIPDGYGAMGGSARSEGLRRCRRNHIPESVQEWRHSHRAEAP